MKSSLIILAAVFLTLSSLVAAAPGDARELFFEGKYEEAADVAERGMEEQRREEAWAIWRAKALMEIGKYPEAQEVLREGLSNNYSSLMLRLLSHEAFLLNGDTDRAARALEELNYLAGSRTWQYQRDAAGLVGLGGVALRLGAEPRLVLENFLRPAKAADPDNRFAHLAIGNLALSKKDYAMAASAFNEAAAKFPNDTEMLYGLAQAHAPGDREQMIELCQKILEQNPRHTGAMGLMVDHLIDAEEYDDARRFIDDIREVNPWNADAWSYLSVIEHLKNSMKGAARARQRALWKYWDNPYVDHLIGKKLSQKYRFTHGAGHQRRALEFQEDYSPAKVQLAQDLLRLGHDDEGWKMALEAHEEDGYDVSAFNLSNLHDTMLGFATITNEHFILRMGVDDAKMYGDEALALLEEARETLCAKYGLELERRTVVEIFPDQKDFGVRTFGMPENPGYLGVCFGSVITANSPASPGALTANWKSVLWHEFCHVVTLTLTENKMPRWLSEGISVHEERVENEVWGQTMNPKYREMILGGELTSIGDLSAAFLTASSNLDLQFAYYESSLAVEFFINQHGIEKLKLILADLREGLPINDAIENRIKPLAELEGEFEEYAKAKAESLAPELDWEKPEEDLLPGWLSDMLNDKPNNYYALLAQAQNFISEEVWEKAKEPLKKLIELYPGDVEEPSSYTLLALVHRQLDEIEEERQTLNQLASRSAEAVDASMRLMELAVAREDWVAVRLNAHRILAVNPAIAAARRQLARALEELNEAEEAIIALRKVLLFEESAVAETHYRLARLLHAEGEPEAKRHVLQALEEAPRYRDAHKLLLDITGPGEAVAP